MEQPRFGKWSVIGTEGRYRLVRCDCGVASRALPYDLRVGKTTMCMECKAAAKRGVKRPDLATHGMADTPEQWVWSDMKRRCYSPNRRGFERYGGRGITVCDRWLSGDGQASGFACFLADMGARPSSRHQLDRKNNDGDYTPGNCRWVERQEQNYNKRNTFRFTAFGRDFTLDRAEAEFGLPRALIWRRIHQCGMSAERALTQPRRITRR